MTALEPAICVGLFQHGDQEPSDLDSQPIADLSAMIVLASCRGFEA